MTPLVHPYMYIQVIYINIVIWLIRVDIVHTCAVICYHPLYQLWIIRESTIYDLYHDWSVYTEYIDYTESQLVQLTGL